MTRQEELIRYRAIRDGALMGIFREYKIGHDMGELGFQLMVKTDTVDSTDLRILQKYFNINTIKVNRKDRTLDFYLNGPIDQ
jgi:hypothetical protein